MDNYHLSSTTIQYVGSMFHDSDVQQEGSSIAAINNVVKLASISRDTVSNIIDHVKVRSEYQEKVEQAIKDLGYAPNTYTRSLKPNRTHTVALILPTVWFPLFSKLASDMEQELCRRGYKFLLCNSQNDYHLELKYASMAKESEVDEILSITYNDVAPYVADANIPIMTIERYPNAHAPFVGTDNLQGGVMAAQKPLKLGYRRLAFIDRLSDKDGVIKLRRDGSAGCCRENGISFIELYSESDSREFTLGIGHFAEQEFKNNTLWDGVFTAVDQYAEYMIDSLRSHNYPVMPGHTLQIIEFNGTRSHTNDRIRISSMYQPVEGIAACAVDTLCRQIVGREVEYYRLFPVIFIQGETTRIQSGLIFLIYLLVTWNVPCILKPRKLGTFQVARN